jgi:hypothetical protein
MLQWMRSSIISSNNRLGWALVSASLVTCSSSINRYQLSSCDFTAWNFVIWVFNKVLTHSIPVSILLRSWNCYAGAPGLRGISYLSPSKLSKGFSECIWSVILLLYFICSFRIAARHRMLSGGMLHSTGNHWVGVDFTTPSIMRMV